MASTVGNQSTFQKTHTVHTGTDIFALFNDLPVSTIQGISYSVTRQKAPIYTMGSADLRAIARSKRGIAGSLIFTTFDRHALQEFMAASTFAAKPGSLESSSANPLRANDQTAVIESNIETSTLGGGVGVGANAIDANISNRAVGGIIARPMYADQLLPFDVTLSSANEYGKGSVMRIIGLEILNEGSGMSIDDTSNEIQMTYLARLILPWVPFANIVDPNELDPNI
jgi:hypothetical protein